MTVHVILLLMVFCIFSPSAVEAASAKQWRGAIEALLEKFGGGSKKVPDPTPTPKHLDGPMKYSEQGGALFWRSGVRINHYRSCPSMQLRVSLPQLNVLVKIPKGSYIRRGPGKSFERQDQVMKEDNYSLDLLSTKGCWVKIRYGRSREEGNTGWIYGELLEFSFDNQMVKPSNRLTKRRSGEDVYALVSRSTYKIRTGTSQGTAVAISPTVLLTNCHVMGDYDLVHIIEENKGYPSVLIHDDYSKDKCFIRSLQLTLRPVSHVERFSDIRRGERAYSVGAPLGYNRTLGQGIVSGKHKAQTPRYVQTTAPISPGSSGGGLFDDRGNLLGITTFTDTRGQNLNFAIASEDFWR
jgi:hypothetical protein